MHRRSSRRATGNSLIATSGASDDGPDWPSTTPRRGTSKKHPGLTVDGETLVLEDEECRRRGTTTFYDNEYTWELSGSTLTLTTVKNDCPDRVAETHPHEPPLDETALVGGSPAPWLLR